ncbi:hypothetical protein [Paenibacillus xylaniclasticus]|uniref:hypothetical protein n=1 Tax=Paenibacillus xylaniclasticus TaxID=588083 RepID=UPI000FD6DB43|nr:MULTISPECIES: hypothetical protein [Paenibacillus]GFN30865.1 hypothetical protein PCURB6_11250 [Paenibacillus curdlanolyticus]
MFTIYDHRYKSYEGMVASPDHQVTASTVLDVIRIIREYGVISIYGKDEMIITRLQFKAVMESISAH